jgi:hypothetical protein
MVGNTNVPYLAVAELDSIYYLLYRGINALLTFTISVR